MHAPQRHRVRMLLRLLSRTLTWTLAVLVALLPSLGQAAPKNTMVIIGTTEPNIAVDPHHPSTFIIGTNAALAVNGKYPPLYAISTDGGRTFYRHWTPMPDPFYDASDPSLAISDNGTMFFAYAAISPGKAPPKGYCGGSPGSSGIFVTASNDHGTTFRPATTVDVNTFDDKPYMTVESIPHRKSHVFVVWNRYDGNANRNLVLLARSVDGGVTFSAPVVVDSTRSDNTGAIPLVGPGHRVYVVWPSITGGGLTKVGSTQVMFSVSTDDGAHFSAPVSIAGPFTSPPSMLVPGDLRMPELVAATTTPKGRIYVTWTAVSHDYGNGTVDADIMLTSSANGGQSWTAPMRVNDATHSDRFMPSVAALADGSAGVAFYDRRAGADNMLVYAAHASFFGGFHVSRNIVVSAGPGPVKDLYEETPGQSKCYSPGRFFGDYIGVASPRGRTLLVVWSDTQQQKQNEVDVWLGRVKLPKL